MADLTITAANVVPGTPYTSVNGIAGVAITAGQVVYLDTGSSTYKLADADSGTAAAQVPAGIALNGAAAGQPVVVLTSGQVTIGATISQGIGYYLSKNPGGIAPVADITGTGTKPVLLGFAVSAAILNVSITPSPALLP